MVDLLWQSRAQFQLFLVLLLAVAAWRRGAGPEQVAAALLFFQFPADYIHHWLIGGPGHYGAINFGHLAIDVSSLVGLCVLAVNANRMYPIWICAAQLIATSMHFVRVVNLGLNEQAYAILNRAPSYLMMFFLALGLIQHRQVSRTFGKYRSWRT